MPNLLEIDSVNKSYGRLRVLSDIYLKCQTGNIIGLLGRNGTGKSTLLKILFGTEPALNKFIRIDGRIHNKTYLYKGDIAYLPQDPFLPRHLSVYKTIELFLGKNSLPLFEQDDITGRLLGNEVGTLSGGESRYLEIKLLLHSPAKFLLLDEPFNGISPLVVDLLKEMIKAHTATKGIILTDHDYRNILDVSNRCCLIYEGCIKTINSTDELVKWGYLSHSG